MMMRPPPRKKASEKDTEAYLHRQMSKIGGAALKWVSPGHNGVPDRICFFPGGLIVFVEVKSEGKVPTDQQLREHERLGELGQLVIVVSSKTDVDAAIEIFSKTKIQRTIGAEDAKLLGCIEQDWPNNQPEPKESSPWLVDWD